MLKMQFVSHIDKNKVQAIAEKNGIATTKEKADEIYEISQRKCPVRTGGLKASAYSKEVKGGYEVGYSAPYAVYVDMMPQSELQSGEAHYLTNAVLEVKRK